MSLDKISTKSRSQSEVVQTSDVEKLILVSDELEVPAHLGAELDKPKRYQRVYSEAERHVALAAIQLNGANVYRTSVALGLPYATLAGWWDAYQHGRMLASTSQGVKERRGDMAAKLEDLVHSAIESAPAKLAKATFSQTMVGVGIGIDKLRILRGQGLEPDPALELCRLLGINRSQLPPTLELEPGEEIDQDVMDILELQRNPDGSFELAKETTEKCSHRERQDTTEQRDQ